MPNHQKVLAYFTTEEIYAVLHWLFFIPSSTLMNQSALANRLPLCSSICCIDSQCPLEQGDAYFCQLFFVEFSCQDTIEPIAAEC